MQSLLLLNFPFLSTTHVLLFLQLYLGAGVGFGLVGAGVTFAVGLGLVGLGAVGLAGDGGGLGGLGPGGLGAGPGGAGPGPGGAGGKTGIGINGIGDDGEAGSSGFSGDGGGLGGLGPKPPPYIPPTNPDDPQENPYDDPDKNPENPENPEDPASPSSPIPFIPIPVFPPAPPGPGPAPPGPAPKPPGPKPPRPPPSPAKPTAPKPTSPKPTAKVTPAPTNPKPTPAPKYSCKNNKTCVVDKKGKFKSKSDCKKNCPKPTPKPSPNIKDRNFCLTKERQKYSYCQKSIAKCSNVKNIDDCADFFEKSSGFGCYDDDGKCVSGKLAPKKTSESENNLEDEENIAQRSKLCDEKTGVGCFYNEMQCMQDDNGKRFYKNECDCIIAWEIDGYDDCKEEMSQVYKEESIKNDNLSESSTQRLSSTSVTYFDDKSVTYFDDKSVTYFDDKSVTYFDDEPYFPEHTVLFKISGRSITNAFPNINLLTINDELYYNPTVNSWLGDFLEVNSKVSGKLTTNFWCNDVDKNDPCWMKDFE